MGVEGIGLHEARTRVTFFLPLNNQAEEKVVNAVIRYLKSQRKAKIPVTGFTHSLLIDAPFYGYWWSDEQAKWQQERVILLVVDYGSALDNAKLRQALGRLKQTIQRFYRQYGSVQEEVWLIAQRVTRYA